MFLAVVKDVIGEVRLEEDHGEGSRSRARHDDELEKGRQQPHATRW